MVRNAGGVACNSLGCKPQDVHPVIEPRRGGTNRNVLRHAKAPCRPSRARNIFLLADLGFAPQAITYRPSRAQSMHHIPPSGDSDPCLPPLQGSDLNPSQFRYCSISFANLIQVKYQRTGRSSWRNLLKKSQIKRPNISISRRLVAK